MKTNDIQNIQHKIENVNLENIFNVYYDSNLNTNDEKYFYNLLKTINFPKDLDPMYYDNYVIKYGDMWPTIAYDFYGNVVLWWLICSANQIQDPTKNPEIGTTIKIIKIQYVPELLNKLS